MEVAIFIIIVLVGLVLFEVFVRRRKGFSHKDSEYIRTNWLKIESLADKYPSRAVLDADKIFAFVLKKKNYKGTVGEMMQKAKKVFSDNNGIWSAHKLRNRIAHEVEIEVSSKQARFALLSFKKAIWDLGVRIKK